MPIILGLGTGRSGTQSLARLVNRQPGAVCFHEANPACMAWSGAFATVHNLLEEFARILRGGYRAVTLDLSAPARDEPLGRLHALDRVTLIGDIAMYYLPYVAQVLESGHDVRFPCLRRPREAVVASYLEKVRIRQTPRRRLVGRLAAFLNGDPYRTSRNHWVDHDGRDFIPDPTWDKCYPKVEASTLAGAIGRYWDLYHAEASALSERYPDAVRIFDLDELNERAGQRRILEFCGVQDVVYSDDVHYNRRDGA